MTFRWSFSKSYLKKKKCSGLKSGYVSYLQTLMNTPPPPGKSDLFLLEDLGYNRNLMVNLALRRLLNLRSLPAPFFWRWFFTNACDPIRRPSPLRSTRILPMFTLLLHLQPINPPPSVTWSGPTSSRAPFTRRSCPPLESSQPFEGENRHRRFISSVVLNRTCRVL